MHTITVVKHNLWSIYFEKNYCYERYERNNVTHWKKSNHRIFFICKRTRASSSSSSSIFPSEV